METTYQNQQQNRDIFTEQPKKGLPGMLNVLTILTFIGCGIAYLSTIWSFIQSSNFEKQKAQMEELQDQLGDSGAMGEMMKGSMDVLQKSYENRYILLISGLLFTTLCLIGAMQMRKLKKSGYPLYVIGELAPLIVSFALLGFSNLFTGIGQIVALVFALLFVILYTTQRKYLVN